MSGRHLSREQKRALIAESLRADPELSNREHARRTGAHKNTVQAIREELESNGQIAHYAPGDRVEASGRAARGAAQQPPRPEPEPEPEPPAPSWEPAGHPHANAPQAT